MIKLFCRYLSIGVLNTLIHWFVFLISIICLDTSQLIANFSAFCIAITFSFFANSKWTFGVKSTVFRYFLFAVFMGLIALTLGWLADKLNMPSLLTLVLFSTVSLFCGFTYSKYVVFRGSK